MISCRHAVFPLTLCRAYRRFVVRGISMQWILIPRYKRTVALPEAALIPLVQPKAETRVWRRVPQSTLHCRALSLALWRATLRALHWRSLVAQRKPVIRRNTPHFAGVSFRGSLLSAILSAARITGLSLPQPQPGLSGSSLHQHSGHG